MPIIHLGDSRDLNKPNFQWHLRTDEVRYTDAENGRVPYEQRPAQYGPFVYATYESHHGLCLYDFERNGYDDSDFYMVVWNDEKHAPEQICFASTRGWSYPCYGSSPDATEETRNKYEQYKDAESRLNDYAYYAGKRKNLCEIRKICQDVAKIAGVPTGKVIKLYRVIGADNLRKIAKLFGPRVRSTFRLSIKQQVINWLNEEQPKYDRPLSPNQIRCI